MEKPDGPKLTDAQREDVGRLYSELAPWIVRECERKYPVDLDWSAAVAIGIIKAVLQFDPAKGTNLETFAWYKARLECVDFIRDSNPRGTQRRGKGKRPRTIPFSVVPAAELSPETIEDHRGAPPSPSEARQEFERHLRAFKPTMRAVFRLLYLENATMAAAGREIGISESRVSQIHSEGIGLLRDAAVQTQSRRSASTAA